MEPLSGLSSARRLFLLLSIGCIQALQCNKNTCPTGITTHNQQLQSGLDPSSKAVRVLNFVNNMNTSGHLEVDTIAHACGVHETRQLKRFHARVVIGNGLSVFPLSFPPQFSPSVFPLNFP